MLLVEPVVIRPLLVEWEGEKAAITAELERAEAAKSRASRTKRRNEAEQRYRAFIERLRGFTVLDPACGSGNFLYLALQALKDLEHRVQLEAEVLGFQRAFPEVGPANVKGIELNSGVAAAGSDSMRFEMMADLVCHNGDGAPEGPTRETLRQGTFWQPSTLADSFPRFLERAPALQISQVWDRTCQPAVCSPCSRGARAARSPRAERAAVTHLRDSLRRRITTPVPLARESCHLACRSILAETLSGALALPYSPKPELLPARFCGSSRQNELKPWLVSLPLWQEVAGDSAGDSAEYGRTLGRVLLTDQSECHQKYRQQKVRPRGGLSHPCRRSLAE